MKKINKNNEKGFTLIELLVVISIIGLLSSVVFASLDSAKVKAKNAVVRTSVIQLSRLLYLIGADNNGIYSSGWLLNSGNTPVYMPINDGLHTCAYGFRNAPATYQSQMIELCNKIANQFASPFQHLYVGFNVATWSNENRFSIQARMPDFSGFMCFGDNGKTGVKAAAPWNTMGCYDDISL